MRSRGAGRRSEVVNYYRPVETANAIGELITTWVLAKKNVWAEVLDLRGREYVAAREIHSEAEVRITGPWVEDLTMKWRVTHGDRTFNILHTVNMQSRRFNLELLCSEVK